MTVERAASTDLAAPAAPPPGAPRSAWWMRVAMNNVFWVLVILILISLGFTLINGAFLSPYNIRSLITDNAYVLVMAVGMVFVLCTAGLDLSVGSVLVLSGVVSAKVFLAFGSSNPATGADAIGWGPVVIGMAAGLAVGTAFGVINGTLIAYAKVPPFITTLGSFGAALGIAYLLTNGSDLSNMPNLLTVDIGSEGPFGAAEIWMIIIVLAIVALAAMLLAYTRFGRYTYAIGSNPESARRVGINVQRHLVKVYGLMGLLAGVAGLLSLANVSTTTISGHTADALSVIGGCVIGGTSLFGGRGTVVGAFIGALIPAALDSGFVIISVSPFWEYVAVGIVLVLAVYFDQWRRRRTQQAM